MFWNLMEDVAFIVLSGLTIFKYEQELVHNELSAIQQECVTLTLVGTAFLFIKTKEAQRKRAHHSMIAMETEIQYPIST